MNFDLLFDLSFNWTGGFSDTGRRLLVRKPVFFSLLFFVGTHVRIGCYEGSSTFPPFMKRH